MSRTYMSHDPTALVSFRMFNAELATRATLTALSAIIGIILLPYGTESSYLTENYPASVLEDGKLDTAELLQKYQYPSVTHFVTTEDGYVLRMHRIARPNGRPVLLMHGLQDSSVGWIIMGPWSSIGYYLFDNGYDVWMGNARGNRYSRNHTTFNPDGDHSFWSFSWHEIGYHDLPAMIDYVLKETGYNKLTYFGHSQGTTAFWVMSSMRPKYNEKIASMHALAPVAFMGNLYAPLLPLVKNFLRISKNNLYEVFPHSTTSMSVNLCFQSKSSVDTCMSTIKNILGDDPDQFNMTMLPVLFHHMPAGANFKQVEHYLQLIDSKRFCQFDYGPIENKNRYNRFIPPDYPLSKITVPVGLYYTYNDYLSSYIDVKTLAESLPNVVENCLYPYKQWNHVSMIWGKDARKLTHARMVEVMRQHEHDVKQTKKTEKIQNAAEMISN